MVSDDAGWESSGSDADIKSAEGAATTDGISTETAGLFGADAVCCEIDGTNADIETSGTAWVRLATDDDDCASFASTGCVPRLCGSTAMPDADGTGIKSEN